MQPLPLPRKPSPITNALTIAVAADADATRRALDELDVFGPAIRALRALGLADRCAPTPHGISWRPDRDIDVRVEIRVASDEDSSSLKLVTRFSARDERAHERLLDALPVLRPLADTLARRAASAVKHHAEDDRFEEPELFEEAMAA
jgi:hypothetical protein